MGKVCNSLMVTERPGAPKRASKRLSDIHVLVVDDDEDTRELIAIVLEDAGATVKRAESVPNAIQAFTCHDFRVLVSDIGMPVEDGYDLIRRLRADGASARSRGVPAVAVTAFSAPEDRKKALAAGFQEHLAKPVEVAALVDVVARLAASNADAPPRAPDAFSGAAKASE